MEIKKIGYPIKRASYTKSLLSRLRAGRSGEAIGTRGGFSPRPDVIAGARCSSPFGPFQRAAPLRAYALATFRSNPPHRSASLHFAHCLRRITGRLLPAILLRQRTPFGNPCKLYVTCGIIAKAKYLGYELAGLVGTAASDLPMPVPCPGFRVLRKNRVGDSLAPSDDSACADHRQKTRGCSGQDALFVPCETEAARFAKRTKPQRKEDCI